MLIKLIKPDEAAGPGLSIATILKVQQVNLPLLAALTPPGHSVELVDESFAPDDPSGDEDLVGITVMTDMALRAYRIADAYRERGARVVLGGIHATVRADEALRHADAVVIGEGEALWAQVVRDAERGALQPRYVAEGKVELGGRPLPLRELYPSLEGVSYTPPSVGVETSRGCPHGCEFCSVHHVGGRRYRPRPVRDVVEEIASFEERHLVFVDDNLAMNRRLAGELFDAMTPLRREWVGETTVAVAEDIELLRRMKRSGCVGLLVGFESIRDEAPPLGEA